MNARMYLHPNDTTYLGGLYGFTSNASKLAIDIIPTFDQNDAYKATNLSNSSSAVLGHCKPPLFITQTRPEGVLIQQQNQFTTPRQPASTSS